MTAILLFVLEHASAVCTEIVVNNKVVSTSGYFASKLIGAPFNQCKPLFQMSEGTLTAIHISFKALKFAPHTDVEDLALDPLNLPQGGILRSLGPKSK